MRGKVQELVYGVMEEVRERKGIKGEMVRDEGMALVGMDSKLDSLGLLTLIVLVQERVKEEWGMEVEIVSESIGLREVNPLLTVGSLIDYVTEMVS